MFRPMPDGATTVFVHIPKTAGTTMVAVIARQNQNKVYWIRGAQGAREEFAALPEAQRASYRMLSGHQPFGMHEHIPRPCAYFTLLRAPENRLVSHYYHILGEHDHYLHALVAGRGMSLLDYVTAGLSIESDNGQTRMLCDRSLASATPIGACREDMLMSAMANLEARFNAVGLTERFDESLALAARYLGWKAPLHYTNARVSDARPPSIPEEVAHAIRRRNPLDVMLHRYVAERFDRHARSLGPSFADEVAAVRAGRREGASP